MKWYNKDKTRMIDMNCINSYLFRDKSTSESENAWFQLNGHRLNLNINGQTETFNGNDADEIYKILLSEKEVI